MTQQSMVAVAIAALGDKVFGVIVSHKGSTIDLMHSGSEGASAYWHATALADDGDEGIHVEARNADMVAALDECAEKIKKIELDDVMIDVDPNAMDEDPAMY